MLKEYIEDAIAAVENQNAYEFKNAIADALTAKAMERIEAERVLAGQKFFEETDELEEAKMEDSEVLKAAKALAANGKDEKTKKFGQGLVDFYKKNDSFTPDQVAGLQNIMKNASFQLADED